MRIRIGLIGLLLFGQMSCSSDDIAMNSFMDDSSITTLNGTWKVISFENYTDNSVELKSQENSRGLDIVLTYNDTKKPNEISGTNTTNTVFGEFEYSGLRKFKVTNYSTTEVAQPAWADKFNEAILSRELDFKINTTHLRIYYANNTRSVTLTQE